MFTKLRYAHRNKPFILALTVAVFFAMAIAPVPFTQMVMAAGPDEQINSRVVDDTAKAVAEKGSFLDSVNPGNIMPNTPMSGGLGASTNMLGGSSPSSSGPYGAFTPTGFSYTRYDTLPPEKDRLEAEINPNAINEMLSGVLSQSLPKITIENPLGDKIQKWKQEANDVGNVGNMIAGDGKQEARVARLDKACEVPRTAANPGGGLGGSPQDDPGMNRGMNSSPGSGSTLPVISENIKRSMGHGALSPATGLLFNLFMGGGITMSISGVTDMLGDMASSSSPGSKPHPTLSYGGAKQKLDVDEMLWYVENFQASYTKVSCEGDCPPEGDGKELEYNTCETSFKELFILDKLTCNDLTPSADEIAQTAEEDGALAAGAQQGVKSLVNKTGEELRWIGKADRKATKAFTEGKKELKEDNPLGGGSLEDGAQLFGQGSYFMQKIFYPGYSYKVNNTDKGPAFIGFYWVGDDGKIKQGKNRLKRAMKRSFWKYVFQEHGVKLTPRYEYSHGTFKGGSGGGNDKLSQHWKDKRSEFDERCECGVMSMIMFVVQIALMATGVGSVLAAAMMALQFAGKMIGGAVGTAMQMVGAAVSGNYAKAVGLAVSYAGSQIGGPVGAVMSVAGSYMGSTTGGFSNLSWGGFAKHAMKNAGTLAQGFGMEGRWVQATALAGSVGGDMYSNGAVSWNAISDQTKGQIGRTAGSMAAQEAGYGGMAGQLAGMTAASGLKSGGYVNKMVGGEMTPAGVAGEQWDKVQKSLPDTDSITGKFESIKNPYSNFEGETLLEKSFEATKKLQNTLNTGAQLAGGLSAVGVDGAGSVAQGLSRAGSTLGTVNNVATKAKELGKISAAVGGMGPGYQGITDASSIQGRAKDVMKHLKDNANPLQNLTGTVPVPHNDNGFPNAPARFGDLVEKMNTFSKKVGYWYYQQENEVGEATVNSKDTFEDVVKTGADNGNTVDALQGPGDLLPCGKSRGSGLTTAISKSNRKYYNAAHAMRDLVQNRFHPSQQRSMDNANIAINQGGVLTSGQELSKTTYSNLQFDLKKDWTKQYDVMKERMKITGSFLAHMFELYDVDSTDDRSGDKKMGFFQFGGDKFKGANQYQKKKKAYKFGGSKYPEPTDPFNCQGGKSSSGSNQSE